MVGEEANMQEEIGILASVDEENWRKQANRIREELAIGDLTKVIRCLKQAIFSIINKRQNFRSNVT